MVIVVRHADGEPQAGFAQRPCLTRPSGRPRRIRADGAGRRPGGSERVRDTSARGLQGPHRPRHQGTAPAHRPSPAFQGPQGRTGQARASRQRLHDGPRHRCPARHRTRRGHARAVRTVRQRCPARAGAVAEPVPQEVAKVDPASSTVHFTNGQSLVYSKLLIATGRARVRVCYRRGASWLTRGRGGVRSPHAPVTCPPSGSQAVRHATFGPRPLRSTTSSWCARSRTLKASLPVRERVGCRWRAWGRPARRGTYRGRAPPPPGPCSPGPTAVAAKPKARIVVVGSSFIGMEAASVLVKEASSIVVVGMEKVPFERVLGEAIGTAMQKLHEEKGVSFRMGAVVDVFEPSGALDAPDAACAAPAPQDSSPALRSTGPDTPSPPAPGYARTHPRRRTRAADGKACVALKLKSGERLEADIVVIGAGVAPTTDFLKGVLTLGRDGSVMVDATLAVTGVKNIYAAGMERGQTRTASPWADTTTDLREARLRAAQPHVANAQATLPASRTRTTPVRRRSTCASSTGTWPGSKVGHRLPTRTRVSFPPSPQQPCLYTHTQAQAPVVGTDVRCAVTMAGGGPSVRPCRGAQHARWQRAVRHRPVLLDDAVWQVGPLLRPRTRVR